MFIFFSFCRVANHTIASTLHISNRLQCFAQCIINPDCISLDYSKHTKECHLNNAKLSSHSEDVIDSHGFDHFIKVPDTCHRCQSQFIFMKHSDSKDMNMTSELTITSASSTENSFVKPKPGTVANLDNSSIQGTSKVSAITKTAGSISTDLNPGKQSSTNKDYSSTWILSSTVTPKETPSKGSVIVSASNTPNSESNLETIFKLDKTTFTSSEPHTTQHDSVTVGPTEISTLPTSTTSNKDQRSTDGQPMEVTHETILTESILTTWSNEATTILDQTSISSTKTSSQNQTLSRELLKLDRNSSNVMTDQLSTSFSTGEASISQDQTLASLSTQTSSTIPPPVCKYIDY